MGFYSDRLPRLLPRLGTSYLGTFNQGSRVEGDGSKKEILFDPNGGES